MAGPVRISARDVARRVRMLIATEDHGDVAAAAQRLRVPVGDLERLDDLIASEPRPRRAALLASVVRSYHTDACWLLTGRESASISELPPEMRVEVAALLSEIGSQILEHYREPNPPVS